VHQDCGFAGGNRLGQALTGNRTGLESPRTPADVHVEIIQFAGRTHDRSIIRRHVTYPGPLTQNLHTVELRKQFQRVSCHLLQRGQRGAGAVSLVRIDLGANHQFAFSSLAHVDVQVRRNDHIVQERFNQLSNAGLERLANDGKRHPGHVRNGRGPAGGGIQDRTRG
jgi:hypothetical protein